MSTENKENLTTSGETGVTESGTKVVKTGSKSDPNVYVHEFKKPFEYENQKYDKITFNFGKLLGSDCVAIDDEMSMEGRYVLDPTISIVFMEKLAAKASEPAIGSDALEALPFGDFAKIKNAARAFLVSTGY